MSKNPFSEDCELGDLALLTARNNVSKTHCNLPVAALDDEFSGSADYRVGRNTKTHPIAPLGVLLAWAGLAASLVMILIITLTGGLRLG